MEIILHNYFKEYNIDYEEIDICYKLILNEPGDDQWDGVFKIYFINCPEFDDDQNVIDNSYSAYGIWKANNGKLNGELNLNKM